MSKRRILGWFGFAAALVWLWYDYEVKAGRAKIDYPIWAGWVTIGLTIAHIWA